jgi:hypothetical protein
VVWYGIETMETAGKRSARPEGGEVGELIITEKGWHDSAEHSVIPGGD